MVSVVFVIIITRTQGETKGKDKQRRKFIFIKGGVGFCFFTFARGQVERLGTNQWTGDPTLQAHVIIGGEASDKKKKKKTPMGITLVNVGIFATTKGWLIVPQRLWQDQSDSIK